MENPTPVYYVSFDEDESSDSKKLDLDLNPGVYGMACLHRREDNSYSYLFQNEINGFEVRDC